MARFFIILAAAFWAISGPSACRSTPEGDEKLQQLAAATARLDADPDSESDLIWVGRRLAYLGRYSESIELYTQGLRTHPDSYRIRRHRGHRYISVRRFDDAIADLQLAAELSADSPDTVEADGMPNARNIPTSTTKSNIYYHLGLALYLEGRFERALDAYLHCMEFSRNDDMRCATSYWLYLTLRRLGRDREAQAVLEPVTPDMQLIENFAYHELLLLFKGEVSARQILHGDAEPGPVGQPVDVATRGYGVGAWHLVNGRDQQARAIFRQVVEDSAPAAFGHIAAETELANEHEPG